MLTVVDRPSPVGPPHDMVQPALWLFQLHYIVTEAARTCYTGDLRPPLGFNGAQHSLRNFASLLLWPAKLALVAAWVLFVVLYVASRFLGETLAREGILASVAHRATTMGHQYEGEELQSAPDT